jgi:predicted ester cyclase
MKKSIRYVVLLVATTITFTQLFAQKQKSGKEVLQAYHQEVWEKKNTNAINTLVDAGLKSADLPSDTKDARVVMVGFLQSFFSAFPDLKAEQIKLFGEADYAVELWIMSGTMKNALWGMPATNKKFEVTGMDIVRVKDGKFIEHYGGLADQMDKIYNQLSIGTYAVKATDNNFAKVISSTKWKHNSTINADTKSDVTQKYPMFIGIGDYKTDGTYEFYNMDGSPKGDKGTWSVSENGKKLSIVSSTFGYKADVDIEKLDENHFDLKAVQYDTKTGKPIETVIALHSAIKK